MVPGGGAQGHELNPLGPVGEQPVPRQMTVEDLLAEGEALLLGHHVETGCTPHRFGAFHDEGGLAGVERVGVDLEEPVRSLLEDEGEGVEREVGAEPGIAGGVPVAPWPECHLVGRSDPAVDPIGRHHQVEIAQLLRGADLGPEAEIDTKSAAALLEHSEQGAAGDRREPLTERADDPAPQTDIDRPPTDEAVGDGGMGLAIGIARARTAFPQRTPPPTRRWRRPIAFEHGDLVVAGTGHEQGEEEPGRAAADDSDPHLRRGRRPAGPARPGRRRWAAAPARRSRPPRTHGRSRAVPRR